MYLHPILPVKTVDAEVEEVGVGAGVEVEETTVLIVEEEERTIQLIAQHQAFKKKEKIVAEDDLLAEDEEAAEVGVEEVQMVRTTKN